MPIQALVDHRRLDLVDHRRLYQVAVDLRFLATDLRSLVMDHRLKDLLFQAMGHHLVDHRFQALGHLQELALEDHRLDHHPDLQAQDLVDLQGLEGQTSAGLLRRPGPQAAKVNLLTGVGCGSWGAGLGSQECHTKTEE